MSDTNNRSGLFVGLNHGFIVKKPTKQEWKKRPVTLKGKNSKRVQAVREIIREVSGFSPLEKKMLELIRRGDQAKEKKAVKIARKKLGTHRRACLKRDELVNIINASKKRS